MDRTGMLGPETPILKLSSDLAKSTPKVEIHRISEYDGDAPVWAWSRLNLGKHSGSDFDAPHEGVATNGGLTRPG